jgi:hypothetical protein
MRLLGALGLLPFAGMAVGTLLFDDLLRALCLRGFLTYSLAILCFLSGTLWGETLPEPRADQRATLLISNGTVLFAVLAMLTAQPFLAALLLMLAFKTLYWFESRRLQRPSWYQVMRWRLTVGVVFSHLLFCAALLFRASP